MIQELCSNILLYKNLQNDILLYKIICDLYLYKKFYIWKCESIYGIPGHI
jgi:hypothetical protein